MKVSKSHPASTQMKGPKLPQALGCRQALRVLANHFAWLALAVACASLVLPSTVLAAPLPEVLIVLDSSQSMQYRVGADQAPTCASNPATDQRSRWIIAHELLAGSFLNYRCTSAALPAQAEVTTPPKTITTATDCLPGLATAWGSGGAGGNVSASGVGQVGGAAPPADDDDDGDDDEDDDEDEGDDDDSHGDDDNDNDDDGDDDEGDDDDGGGDDDDNDGDDDDGGGDVSNVITYQDGFKMKDTKLPYFTVPLVPGRTFTSFSLTMLTAASSPQVVLTLVKTASPTDEKAFKCEADGRDRIEVTAATLLTSGKVTFVFTPAGQAAIKAFADSGATSVKFAMVPAHSSTNPSCNLNSARSNTYDNTDLGTFHKTKAKPIFVVAAAQFCPAEGPATHSFGLGIDGLGAVSSVPNGHDGLLDVLGPSAKFALLTMDQAFGAGTTAAAGYSFGAAVTAPWGQVNLGINSPFLAGSPAVPITRLDTVAARADTYAKILASLQSIQPFGPTPIGQQLADALAYYATDPYRDDHFKAVADDPDGDPYLACRTRMVVVISDGGSNAHDGTTDGRAAALQVAAQLKARGVKVYVLAVGHPASGVSGGPPAADLQFLNDLAAAGGTVRPTQVATPQDAVQALGPAVLSTQLDSQTYARPVTATATGTAADVLHAFYSLSTFDISQPLRTRGTIEQRVFKCDSACQNSLTPGVGQVCEVIDYGAKLVAKGAQRKIYTHKTGSRIGVTNANLSPSDVGIGNAGVAQPFVLNQSQACVAATTYNLSQDSGRNNYRDYILGLLTGQGTSCRSPHPLGAVGRSQMGVLEPANRTGYREPSFLTYMNRNAPSSASYSDSVLPGSSLRPTMLFAATHDGLLHAFRTDRSTTITTQFLDTAGDEMWAWLPKFSHKRIAQMRQVTVADASYMGGSITTGHIQLSRTGTEQSADQLARKWRAVVVVGAGTAGVGYTALDVTAPDDPRLLWEITPESRCYGGHTSAPDAGPTCVATTAYANLGRSTAKPILTNLYFRDGNGTVAQRSVVIIPLGLPASQAGVSNLGVEGNNGRGVAVIDLETGALIRELATADMDKTNMPVTGNDADLGYFASGVTCAPAGTGQIATRCFVGDTKGMLWRLDLTDVSPANWKLRFFHDAYGGPNVPSGWVRTLVHADRAPVSASPSVSLNAAGNLVVIYGTGNGDDESSESRRHHVLSLTETFVAVQGGQGVMPQATVNWYKQLAAYERFIGPPVVFALHAYWASWEVQQDGACLDGTGRIWGARFERSQAPSDPSDLLGAFPDPQRPASKSANFDFVSLGAERPSPVDVQPMPACRGNCSPTDPNCIANAANSGLSGGRPEYQVQVATPVAGTQAAGLLPKTGTPPAVGTATQDIPQPRATAVVTGWDLLLE